MRELLDEFNQSRGLRFFIYWHFAATFFALVLGLAGEDFSLFLSIAIWTGIALLAYKLEPPYFILSAFILAAIEEFIVYQFGGGLQGEAQSLLHDYINALPVFLGIIVGWYMALRKYDIGEFTLYVMVGLHGALIELVFQGIIFDPILLFLFGGPNFFIYASIVISPRRPRGEQEFTLTPKLLTWVGVFILMLLGAIIADNLNAAFGFI